MSLAPPDELTQIRRRAGDGASEVDDGDAGSAELHMLVGEVANGGHGGEVLADEGAQDAGAGTVENAHTLGANEYGIVDVVLHGLDGLGATHAAHIELLAEVELAPAYAVLRLSAEESGGAMCGRRLAGR